MEIRDYQEKSKRTVNKELNKKESVTNMLMGIHGETGEVADLFKKYFYQGHELDLGLVSEEIGDTLFYIVNLCNIFGIDMRDVLQENYNKLLKRYPEGFDVDRSLNRER